MKLRKVLQNRLRLKHRIMIAILYVLIPVSVVFAGIIKEALNEIQDQVVQANMNSLQIYRNTLQTEIELAEQYLIDLTWVNEEFAKFYSTEDDSEAEKASQAILSGMEDVFQANKDITAFIVYNPGNGIYRTKYNQIVAYGKIKQGIELELKQTLKSKEDKPLGWFLMNCSGRWLLSRIAQRNGAYAVCLVDLTQAVRNARLNYNIDGEVFFIKKGTILANKDWMDERGIRLDYSKEEFYYAGKKEDYIIVQKQLAGFKVGLAMPSERNNERVKILYFSPVIYLGAAVLSLVCAALYLKHELFIPMDNLVITMRRIQGGDLTARPLKYKGTEFAQVHGTFNSMMSEITTLRIKSYEQQLMAEKAQLEALRMQIRPHFFLNCLKSIFGLAQAGKTEEIKKSVLCLSPHLRYIFDISTEVITLEKELQMCENYISLQVVSQCGSPKLNLSVDTNVLMLKVPPVSILTLVENCMKHGMAQDGTLRVQIIAKSYEIDGQRLADIVVRDNGPGFPEKVLKVLNNGEEKEKNNSQVGLRNVMNRFKVLYGDDLAITFSNNDGAQVEIMFLMKEEGEVNSNNSLCQ